MKKRVSSEAQIAERLKGVPLFSNSTAKHRRTLAKLGRVLSWKAGSTPINQGSRGAAFFLILEGSVEVSRNGTAVARLEEGDFVGEIALLTNEPRNADVSALTDTTVFAFSRIALAGALKAEPSLSLAMLEAMAVRQQSLQ